MSQTKMDSHLFLSIDLIDSTKNKADNKVSPRQIYNFFWMKGGDSLVDGILTLGKKQGINLEVFKSIGDEVVFQTLQPLKVEIDFENSQIKLEHETEAIKLIGLFDKLCSYLDDHNHFGALKIKATLWLVPFIQKTTTDKDLQDNVFSLKTFSNNIEKSIKVQNKEIKEYYGTALDHGFRIASLASEGNFVVSGLLIHLLSNAKSISITELNKIDVSYEHPTKLKVFDVSYALKNKVYKVDSKNKVSVLIRNAGYAPLKGFKKQFAIFTVGVEKKENIIRMAILENKIGYKINTHNLIYSKSKKTKFSFDDLVSCEVFISAIKEKSYFNQ